MSFVRLCETRAFYYHKTLNSDIAATHGVNAIISMQKKLQNLSKIGVASHKAGVAETKVGGAVAPPTEYETPPVFTGITDGNVDELVGVDNYLVCGE